MRSFIFQFELRFISVNFQADKVIQDKEKEYEQKIEEYKEESRQHLLQVQEEHAALVCYYMEKILNLKQSRFSLFSYQNLHKGLFNGGKK